MYTLTLDRLDSNALLSHQFGTSRGSFLTESVTGGISVAMRQKSGMIHPSTFVRSSDSSDKSESSSSENSKEEEKE